MRHEVHGHPSYVLYNKYDDYESSFKQAVSMIPRDEVPSQENISSSHTIYKSNVHNDSSFSVKARIALHGNEYDLGTALRSSWSICRPVGILIMLSGASLQLWSLQKFEEKSAFLQMANAHRDVHVVPPTESTDRGNVMSLLRTAM